jgi:two-component system, LytTR family, sensor kinase
MEDLLKALRHRRWLVHALLSFGLFGFLILFFASEYFFLKLMQGTNQEFYQHLMTYTVRWLPWPFLVPLVIRLARRFPLEGKKKIVHGMAHLGWSLAASVFQPVVSFLLISLTRPWWAWKTLAEPGSPLYIDVFVKFFHINILTYWIILGVNYGTNYYRRYRERELASSQLETQLARTRLQALSSQLHPHFLFNTLHMISALVYRQPRMADSMITRLSDLLRVTLDQSNRQEIPLREEAGVLANYVEIMKTRFEDRLDITLEIPSDTECALVPNFILQPLVENAIHHGFMPGGHRGSIRLSAMRQEGNLVIDVVDNGRGFPKDLGSAVEKGFGLRNTRDRLHYLYGDAASMKLENDPGGGARLTLTLPYRVGQSEPTAGGPGIMRENASNAHPYDHR